MSNHNHDNVQFVCFQHLRDTQAVTDNFDQSSLSSYYLKTAFLNEERRCHVEAAAQDCSDEDFWTRANMCMRIANMVRSLEQQTLNSYLFQDCLVYNNAHEDRSFLEARRMIRYTMRQQFFFKACLIGWIIAGMFYLQVLWGVSELLTVKVCNEKEMRQLNLKSIKWFFGFRDKIHLSIATMTMFVGIVTCITCIYSLYHGLVRFRLMPPFNYILVFSFILYWITYFGLMVLLMNALQYPFF